MTATTKPSIFREGERLGEQWVRCLRFWRYATRARSRRHVDTLAHRCRGAVGGRHVRGAIELTSGELDPSVQQGCSVSRLKVPTAHRVPRSRSPISIEMRPSNA